MTLSGPQLVLLVVLLLVVGPIFGYLLTHHGFGDGHKHVNHWLPAIVLVTLVVAFFWNTPVAYDFYHAFDSHPGQNERVARNAPRPPPSATRRQPPREQSARPPAERPPVPTTRHTGAWRAL